MLRSVGGLPPHIVAQFEEPSAFQQSASCEFFLFDRGRHAIYAIDAAATVATRIVDIGLEAGRVIQAGRPAFRKYDATGRLRFERHIEGPELDPLVLNLPTTWAREDIGRGEELPVVPIAVRTAVVDPDGRLWVVLSTAYTYVYDQFGDKQRTVQFRGAGPVHPVSLAFDAAGRILVAPGCYVFDRP